MNQKSRLMIIDDDVSLLKTVEHILIEQGYIVSLAKSGKQAISAIEKGNIPDLILLDIAMPEMDGYATFNAIKQLHNIPIIFLTSLENMQAELTGLELGAIDYITKPFVTDILLARIKNHLRNIYRYAPIQESTAAIGETDKLTVTLDRSKLDNMKALLTESEYKVGKMIALGYSNQEIASELNYSYSYVKKIAYRIFDKLQISKRHELRPYFTK
ncbi:MAG: response regulator [Lachnospiraceae bacterium]|nr:response regulator [Lachnospiraceae bacterium]